MKIQARGLPVRAAIAGMVVGAMVIMTIVVLSIGWFGSRQILLDTATRTARDAGQITIERSRRMIDPGAATLRTLTFDPIVTSTRLEDRLSRVGVFAAELSANELVSAIYVGFENGDFLLVRPLDQRDIRQRFQAPTQANFLVQTVTTNAQGVRVGAYHFFDASNRLLLQREIPDYQFDPRQRAWYVAAKDTVSTVVSKPYVFFSTRQVGISLSKLATNGKTIVALDMTLDDLANSLGDLRITPGSELALVGEQNEVVAYRDMRAVLLQRENSDEIGFRTLSDLGVQALTRLQAQPQDERAVSYQADGKDWLGISMPFDAIEGVRLRLLVTAPADELLGDLQRSRDQLILIATGLILLFLPLGWWAGSSIGKAMEQVAARARRMSAFDFSRPPSQASSIREVSTLHEVVDNVSVTVEAFLDISHVLGAEARIDSMLGQVLEKIVAATRSDGGGVYLWQRQDGSMLRAAQAGPQGGLQETFAYAANDADRLRSRALDATHQRTEFELRGRSGQLEGLLVLVHSADQMHAAPEFQAFVTRLTGMLAVAIETRQLIEAQKNLFDAVIRVLADAIDAKSPYTGGHCERVPELALMLVDQMSADQTGPYAAFQLSENQRYAFYLGAWLHDCGKVTSSEHIVDKATKLEGIYNRIHEIRMRFEVLWRDAEISSLRAQLAGADATTAQAELSQTQQQLQADFRFVAESNVGGEFMSDEAIARLRQVAQTHWQRHFDDTLGLGVEELRRLLRDRPTPVELPATEQLLADRADHIVPWGDQRPAVEIDDPRNIYGFDMRLPAQRQNMGELHNLSIRRGTLTDEDRFAINDHIVQTYIMLKKLPWPAHLEQVPHIAATHHEKMDGQGYPRRLPGEALQTTDRIMALADIFEALTAADRPYKPPKTLSESLRIMAFMSKDRHIDVELYLYFLRNGIWRVYAQRYLSPAQIDEVDVDALARIAQAPAR
ncbi:HD domain-containing phosphohydrolase [Variovorax sp. HJSM1_2]|uniref:HD domain-containing phosphohydrolase n=1 Tax=Variovorax sp. HJSM1_2 TaxID=3366263 RepID=UPI003BD2FEB4